MGLGYSNNLAIDSLKNILNNPDVELKISEKFHLYSELNDLYKEAQDTNNYVSSSIKMADLSRAVERYNIAIQILDDLVESEYDFEPFQKIDVCLVRGSVLYELAQHKESIFWAHQGLAIAIKYNEHRYDALLNNLLGAGYQPSNKDSSIKYFEISIRQFIANEDSRGAILPKINLSRMYAQNKEYNKSIDILKSSLLLLDEDDIPIYRQMIYANFANAYNDLKDFEKSTHYLYLRDSIHFIINNNQNQFQVSQLQEGIEEEKQVIERKILETQIEMARVENQRIQITIALAIVIILALIIGLFVAIRISKKRKQITKSVANKAKELETVNKFKNQVLSVISHDMRSPLAQIITFQHAKNSGINFSPDELKEMDKTIMASAKNGLLILDNLLKWANHQFSGEEISISKVDSSFVLKQLLNQVLEISKEKEIVIHSDIAEIDIYTNESLFQIVIRNLLNNAIKFSPTHAEVRLISCVKEGVLEVSITDQGPGMPEKIIADLEKGTTIKPKLGSIGEKGAGIGLTFSKEFAQRINGSFQFTPDMLIGTEVTFSIPVGNPE
jgi:signal transduction histidine kinase